MYANISPYGGKNEMGGGAGIKYAASTVVYLSKKKITDTSNVKNLIGNEIICKLQKSRLTKESKVVETRLFFDHRGLDKYHGLIDLGVKHGIFQRKGAWYSFGDMKFQNKDIEENIEEFFDEEKLNLLDEAAAKEFCYGGE